MMGNDALGRRALEELSLSVRPAAPGSQSWRHETARASYAELRDTVARIGTRFEVNVIQMARLGRGGELPRESNSLPFIPAASVRPGMAMFDEDGGYDVVESVERVPLDGPVYDLDVEDTHNFIANGIVAHNSLEQDADVVLLINRPDAWERDDPRAGEADLIIAKHRAGPTATITVAHQLHYSRFTDLAQQ